MRVRSTLAAALIASGLIVAACGDDNEDDQAATTGAEQEETTTVPEVPAAPTLAEASDATGSVTFCAAKDLSGDHREAVELFTKQYESQGLKADLLEFAASADEQRSQFVQRQEAKSSECDVFWSDVVWTAEFAAQGWLLDTSEYVKEREGEFVASTLETVEYGGRHFGVPQDTDAGLLYYRTDKVSEAPTTWQSLYEQAAENGSFAYQGASYEGLTCDFLEIAFAAGGQVLSDDGKESMIDSPENLAALELMVSGTENGAALNGVTTYMEEESRRAFEAGKATFMRNWPYAYSLGNKAPKVKGKFAVAPLPEFDGAGAAGILGGHNAVISSQTENPEGAILFVDFITSPETMKRKAVKYSRAPVLSATYDDPEVQKALPFATELKQAVEQAKSRPVSPVYPQISQAIYRNVNAALSGKVSPEDALQAADQQITEALATF